MNHTMSSYLESCHLIMTQTVLCRLILSVVILYLSNAAETVVLAAMKSCPFPCQVMDKYGDLYGCEKISELLGLDQAALDFSSERKERKKLMRHSAWSNL